MENWSLYEDASLLAGCLLAEFPPVTFESVLADDGLKVHGYKGQPCPTTNSAVDLMPGFSEFQSPVQDLRDPLGESWFDTKIDLLDLFDTDLDNSPSITKEEPLIVVAPGGELAKQNYSLNVLETVSEETIKDLSQPGHESTGLNAASLLLDMLSEGMPVDDPLTVLPSMDTTVDLSPMSPEDVDSILSSTPVSPWDGSTTNPMDAVWNEMPSQDSGIFSTENSFVSDIETPAKVRKAGPKRSTPYKRPEKEPKTADRRMRKKQQNKDAATRYRVKKRIESDSIGSECEQLESRNKELKDKVGQMTNEIQYLKDLLAEVYQAKGMLKCNQGK